MDDKGGPLGKKPGSFGGGVLPLALPGGPTAGRAAGRQGQAEATTWRVTISYGKFIATENPPI